MTQRKKGGKDLATVQGGALVDSDWRAKLDLVKNTVGADLTGDEFELLIHRANRLQLDPLQRQIYAWPQVENGKRRLVFMVGIDGLRLVAHRTGKYVPGTIEFGRDAEDRAFATATVNIIGPDDQWHKVERTAYFNEFAKTFPDSGKPKGNWAKMPRHMIGKCAEALALRTAFPDVLSNVYTPEEMDQASNAIPTEPDHDPSTVEVVPESSTAAAEMGGAVQQLTGGHQPKASGKTPAEATPPKAGTGVQSGKPTEETKDAIAQLWRMRYPDDKPVWTAREIADHTQRLSIDLTETNFQSMLAEIREQTDERLAVAAGDAPADGDAS